MADVTIGAKLSLDANDGISSLKQLKQQIKEAQGDLVAMSDKFGATSEQARMAAKRVAELQDNLGDAKTLVDAFNPDQKFRALGQALNGVLGGFTALTGAMGLLGVESEDVQKQLLKVQSAMAFSQGLNQVGDSINSFKNLGKTIVDTLGKGGAIGLAIAGVGALVASVTGLFDKTKELESGTKQYAEAAVNARVQVLQLSEKFKQARSGVISKKDALDEYNSTIGKTVGQAKDLNQAEEMLRKNAEAYIRVQSLKAQANFLLQKSAELYGRQVGINMEMEKAGITVESLRDGGGIGSAIASRIQKQISDLDKDQKAYEQKAQEVFSKINEVNSKYGFSNPETMTGPNKTASPSVKQKKEEISLLDQLERDAEIRRAQERGMREKELRDAERAKLEETKNRRFEDLDNARMIDASKIASLQQVTMSEEAATNFKIQLAEKEQAARIQAAGAIGSALGALSDLVGKQTAAGKVLGIAQATINTFIGATEVLRARSVLAEPFGTIAKIANVAAIIASGIAAVKNIVKTPVPGASGSSGASSLQTAQNQLKAPLQPQLNASRTVLNADQLNQIGNATVRAFVVESDVSGSQERIRRLNRAARI